MPAPTRGTTVNFGNVYGSIPLQHDFDIDRLPGAVKEKFREYKDILAEFTEEELVFLRWRMMWKTMARVKQLPPEEFEKGDKSIWGLRSGRGFGKTLSGSNWLGIEAAAYPSNYAVVAPTKDDVRYTCFEGPTGLLSVIPPSLVVDQNKALPAITLWNGSIIRGFAGDTPERLRGPQHAKIWCDEIASWLYPEDAWSNMMFGLRLGPMPQILWTGTPKPSYFIRDLVKNPDSVVVVGSTYENQDNLPKMFFISVSQYEGTKIGRQELHGEVLDPEEAGFIKRSDWRQWPSNKPLPQFQFIVMSLDTAFTERTHNKKKQESDPTACTVWGLFLHPDSAGRKLKNIMLIDAWEDWLTFPELVRRVKKERRYLYGSSNQEPLLRPRILSHEERAGPRGKKIDVLLIEEKGSGISLRQTLAVEEILTEGYNPGRLDKLGRLHVISPLFAHRRIWAVASDRKDGKFKDWAEPVVGQVCTYTGPGSLKHDDLLDTSTQALRLLKDRFIGALTVKRDPDEAKRKAALEESKRVKRPKNPYDA